MEEPKTLFELWAKERNITKVTEALDLEHLSSDDLPALNRMCQAIAPLNEADSVAPPLRGRPAALGSATMFSDTVVAAYRQELSQLPQRQQEAPQEAPPAPTMTM